MKLVIPSYLQKKAVLSAVLFYLFVVFSITAVLNPKWGTGYAAAEFRKGLDTVFAVDVSRSMDVRDVQMGGTRTSRLERGIFLAREAAKAVPGGRFAAAIGRGAGYLSVPLAFDNEAAVYFLETLDSQTMTGRSTNLQTLIEAASSAFQTTSGARRVIVLISDGESHFGVLRNALNSCIRDGIIIIAVGIGSDEGAPVPGITEEPIPVSQRDTSVMRMAAERTGGVYIDGNRDDAASVLRTQLISFAQDLTPSGIGESGASERKTEPKPRRGLFAILAIIVYGASKFVPRVTAKKSISRAAVSLTAFVLLLSSCTEGKLLLLEANYLYSRGRFDEAAVSYYKALEHEDTAPYAEYGLGIIYHSMDESSIALNRYANSQGLLKNVSVTEHRELRYRTIYNTGIIYFEEGDYNAAAAAFKDALKIDPSKIDAKRNLEISLMSIARDTPQAHQPEMNNEAMEIIYEYIRQQEEPYWKSGEWQAEEKFTGPDY